MTKFSIRAQLTKKIKSQMLNICIDAPYVLDCFLIGSAFRKQKLRKPAKKNIQICTRCNCIIGNKQT